MILAGHDKGTKPTSPRCTHDLNRWHTCAIWLPACQIYCTPSRRCCTGAQPNNLGMRRNSYFYLDLLTCFKCGVCYSGITPAHCFVRPSTSKSSVWVDDITYKQSASINSSLYYLNSHGCRNYDYYSVAVQNALLYSCTLYCSSICDVHSGPLTIKIMKRVYLMPRSKLIFTFIYVGCVFTCPSCDKSAVNRVSHKIKFSGGGRASSRIIVPLCKFTQSWV